MSLLLIQQPISPSLSADLISAKFFSNSFLQQQGVFSVNEINFAVLPAADANYLIKFGNRTVAMVAKDPANVDDSGLTFDRTNLATIFSDFSRNALLSSNYDIAISGSKIVFTAKVRSQGFDFTSGGTNTIPGSPRIVKPNYTIYFRLWLENESNTGFDPIYTTNQTLFEDGSGEVVIGDKLHANLTKSIRLNLPEQPNNGLIQCRLSCRRYYFEFAESFGDIIAVKKITKSPVFTILHGGLSSIAQFNTSLSSLINPSTEDKDRFLKQGATQVYTRSNQPQFLYFYNNRQTVSVGLKIRFIDNLGGDTTITRTTFNMEEGRKYAFDVTFDKLYQNNLPGTILRYEVWLDNNGRKSEVRTFHLNYQLRNYIRYFLNWSSFGSLDSRVCYGKGESEFELFNKTAERIRRVGDNIQAGQTLTFDSRIKRGFKVSTGWITRSELQLNADFFLSNFKYRYVGGLMLPIEISPGRIPELTDGENLLAQQFEYKYHFDDHNYTEGDAEDAGLSFGSFFFSSASIGSNPTGGIQESDPTVPVWVKSITAADIVRWNTPPANVSLTNYYTKTEINNLLSGAGISKAQADTYYQPLENQRLSTVNNVSFTEIRATSKMFIPGSTQLWQIYVDEAGTGGSSIPSPGGSLSTLSDVNLAGLTDGKALVYNAATGKWVPGNAGSAPVDLSNYYTKIQVDNAISNYSPIWNAISGKPTKLSDFTNDLGNYGNWLSASAAAGTFQPLENQRLSTVNNVSFTEIRATSKMFIPGANQLWQIYVDENGTGGGSGPVPGGSQYLSTLLDVQLSNIANGQALVFDSGLNKWINQNFTIPNLTNYHRYAGFGTDANNIAEHTSTFTYANNAPYTGTLLHFGANNYGTQFNTNYGNGAYIAFRTRNGDAGTWNPWRQIWNDATLVQSVSAVGNSVVQRDANGYIFNSYINTTDDLNSNPANLGYLIGKAGDNYHRSFTVGAVQGWLGLGDLAYANNSIIDLQYATNRGNVTTTGIGVIRDNVGHDPYGPISVTRGQASDFSYYGLTRSGSIGWGIGIDTSNRLVFGTGSSAVGGAIFTTISHSFDASGNASHSGRVRGLDFWSSGWYYTNGQAGIYSATYSNGLRPKSPTIWDLYTDSTNEVGLSLSTIGNATQGYLYAESNGNIGLLGYDGNWGLKMDASKNIFGSNTINAVGHVRSGNWLYSNGNTGWYNETYGGGINMYDPTYIRTYGSKTFYCDRDIIAASNIIAQNGQVIADTGGFKSTNYTGMVGDYDTHGSTDKIIWTIGDQWNTIGAMYGLGYSYNSSIFSGQHQIVGREQGITRFSLNLGTGGAYFTGMLYAAGGLRVPEKNTSGGMTGNTWEIYIES